MIIEFPYCMGPFMGFACNVHAELCPSLLVTDRSVEEEEYPRSSMVVWLLLQKPPAPLRKLLMKMSTPIYVLNYEGSASASVMLSSPLSQYLLKFSSLLGSLCALSS